MVFRARSALMEIRRGPGGNPVRKLAVLALSRLTLPTQLEVGRRLGTTSTQAAQILHRFRGFPPEPVIRDLAIVERKVSIGNA
jgi:hypothetical protein